VRKPVNVNLKGVKLIGIQQHIGVALNQSGAKLQ
jgi:hypothetical protein